MLREIIFRGKRIKDGEWIFGDLVQDNDLKRYYIHYFEYSYDNGCPERTEVYEEVDKDTIGQYSGIKEDKNLCIEYHKGYIYEGDVIHSDGWEDKEDRCEVKFEDGKFVAYNPFKFQSRDLEGMLFLVIDGNIHDNPELLK